MRHLVLAAAAAALLILGAPGAALAQVNTPVGLWTVSFFVDNAPNMPGPVNQQICFQANGSWFSPTFGGWAGRWFQKGANAAGNGDRVRVLGNFFSGDGNDSAELEFVNLTLMTGPWTEWLDNLSFVNWTQTSFTRISTTCPAAAAAAKPPEGAYPTKPNESQR